MRKHLLAAAAALAIASPAAARDGAGYIGVEGGIVFDAQTDFDLEFDGDDDDGDFDFDDALELDFKRGLDVDLIGGYDFGAVRAEAELGYKRLKVDNVELSDELIDFIEDETGDEFIDDDFDADGRGSVLSLMGNVLFDVGGDEGFGFYAGGGLGRARVKILGESDGAWAYQLIAGARTAISQNIDLGLKYRYFRTTKLDFEDEFGDDAIALGGDGRFSSHSLLASLIFNFAPPPPAPVIVPPPPAPMAPATQTCPDGSVILATDVCPLPPAPPPPPPPAGERG